ncbi:MAG: hypothetical protein AMK72_09275 [Planctomycetes bacterium SM23_25]|nr:MAG: hypothetical protein AMK72_09275 [Planctomycetes bacterium SM23_25]
MAVAAILLPTAWETRAAPAPEAPPSAQEAKTVREQSIYIPYEKLREVFEKQGRGVFLPYEKFQELWKAARDKTAPPPEAKPPVDALITEVSGAATVSKDVVTVEATVKFEVLKEGWNEVPLRLGDVALTKATLGQEPARVVFDSKTGYALLVEKKGKDPQPFTLALGFAKAYSKAPGQNSVSFESPQAPVSKWEVRIPESGVKVNIHPLLAATEVPPAPGAAKETVVLAFVGAAPTVRIDWTPKAEGAKGLAALASVQVEQQTTIEEGVTRTRATLAYEISRAELASLEVEVPADQKVAGVFDPNVREWAVAAADGAQKITVQLFEPAKETQNLTLELEKFAAEQADQVKVPVLRALGVGRQQGVVVVQVAPGLRAEAVAHSGLLQLDAAELPATLAKAKWEFSYRYAALPFDLTLGVEKVQPRILADSLVEAHLGTEALTVDLLTVYTVERAGVFRFEIDVPAGYDVRSVRGTAVGKGVQPAQVDAHHLEGPNKTRLVVNLSRKAMGKVALAVALHKTLREPDLLTPTGKAANIPLAIPRVAPGSVERETGRLVVYAPESLRVNPDQPTGLRTVTFQEATKDMRQTPGAGERPVLAFAYTEEPASLALAAERRKPHVTVAQLLVAQIDSGVVKYSATFSCDVLYSGVKNLRLDVPQDLAPDIRVTPLTIRHETVAEKPEDLADGYVAWQLTGDTEFMGSVRVTLAWEKKIEKLDVGKSVDLEIPRLIPRAVDRAWGQIVLAKAETIDVQPAEGEDKVKGLRPIDPQHDLMPGAAVKAAARAFEFHEDWALTVVATMYKLEDVKHTAIERALVRMVVTRSDLISVQALYRAQSARQRLLVRLPANVNFDTEPLRINGRPVSLERGDAEGSTFYVPLVGQQAGEPFLLELRYTVAGAGLTLECPVFPEEPAVQKVHLSAWLPSEWDYLGFFGPWTDENVWDFRDGDLTWRLVARRNDASLIQWVREGLKIEGGAEQTFQTDGRQYLFSTLRPMEPPEGSLRLAAMDGDYLAVLVFVVILGAGVALLLAPWTKRCIAVGAFVVLMVLLGVFAPTFTAQVADGVMAAAVFVVAVIWLLWYLLWTRRHDPRLIERRKARRAAREAALARARAAAQRASTPATKPPPADEAKPVEGETQSDQKTGPPTQDQDAGKEGGEDHA